MAYTIGDCVENLPSKGAGRTSWGNTADGSLGIVAVAEAVKELTETLEFEELKYLSPIPPANTLALTVGNPIIPISTILATIPPTGNPFSGENVIDITDVYTIFLWFAPGVNSAGRTLEYRRITTLDMYTFGVTSSVQNSYGVAPPVYYSRFGTTLQVGPAPDQNYNYFARVKLRHPLPASDYADQVIFAPDSWQEVFEYSAIARLAQNEGITNSSIYATATNFLKLRGADPASLRQMQMLRDERHSSRSLSVRIGKFTHS